jgi:hypothetical protein
MIPDVREVFDLLEFENILQSYPDADLAVASFGPIVPANTPFDSSAVAGSGSSASSSGATHRSETVLSDEDLVREIARKHPEFGLMRIQKELRRAEHGGRELNPVQLYVLLRKLELDTRERRVAYAQSGSAGTVKSGPNS